MHPVKPFSVLMPLILVCKVNLSLFLVAENLILSPSYWLKEAANFLKCLVVISFAQEGMDRMFLWPFPSLQRSQPLRALSS